MTPFVNTLLTARALRRFFTAIATVTLVVGALFSIVYIKVLKPEVD